MAARKVKCKHSSEIKCPTCAPELWSPGPEQARKYTIKFLADKISKARLAYEDGQPIMRDEEFDALEKSLRAYDPNHRVLHKVGTGQGDKSCSKSETKSNGTAKPAAARRSSKVKS